MRSRFTRAPDQCNDMHGMGSCNNGCTSGDASACIREGDRWLERNVPPIVDFINAHGGVLFVLWDESEGANPNQPFVVVGPGIKRGHVSSVTYSHASYVNSVQTILGLAIDPRVSAANDFADFFEPNQFPAAANP